MCLFFLCLLSFNFFGQSGVSITSPASPGPTSNSPIPIDINFSDGVDELLVEDFITTNAILTNLKRLPPNFQLFEHLDLIDFQVKANYLDYILSGLSLEEYMRKKIGRAIVAIEVNSSNEIFYLTYSEGLYKFNPGGSDQIIIPGTAFNSPMDFVISSTGQFIIADKEKYEVKIYNSAGVFSYKIGGSMGKDGNEFYGPTGLAIDSNDRLYVSDAFTGTTSGVPDQVKIYNIGTSNYTFVNRYNSSNGITIKDPYRIAVDNKGFVYLSDSGGNTGNGRVLIFNDKYEWIKTIEGGEQGAPGSLVVDDFGYLYVIDYEADITFNGIFENPIELLSQFNVIKGENYVITVYNPDYTFSQSITEELHLPIDLTLNGCGKILVNDLQLGGTVNLTTLSVDATFNFDINKYTRRDNFYAELIPTTEGKVEVELKDEILFKCEPQPQGYFSIIYESEEVEDITPPVFTNCPTAELTFDNDEGECGALINYDIPIATDDSGTEPTVVWVSGPRPGEFVAVGETKTVTYRATDGADNTTDCTFTIKVEDNEAPIFTTCIGNEVQQIFEENGKFTVPDFRPAVSASDNCSTATGITYTQSILPGTELTSGTFIHIFAYDEYNNESKSCSFEVVLVEEEKPSFECGIPPASLDLDINCEYPELDFSYLITNRDNFADGIYISQVEERVNNQLKVNLKIYHGTGVMGDLVGECSFKTVLLDEIDPVIQDCNQSPVHLNLSPGESFTVPDYSDRIEYSDNCGPSTIIQIPAIGSVINQNSMVTLLVKDESGNTSSECSFAINYDQTENSISCRTAVVSLGADGTATLEPALVFDGNSNDPKIEKIVVSPNVFDCGDLGMKSVELSVTYNDGSTAKCTTQVEVVDEINPETVCKNISENFDPEVGYVIPDFKELYEVKDNCNFTVEQTPSPGTVVFESQQIDLIIKDSGENETLCYFVLTLNPITQFKITSCPGDQKLEAFQECGVEVPDYTMEGETSVPYAKVEQQPAPGTVLYQQTDVTLTFTSPNGETDSCTFTIEVENIPLEYSCPEDVKEERDENGSFTLPKYEVSVEGIWCEFSEASQQTPAEGTVITEDTKITITFNNGGTPQSCSFMVLLDEPAKPEVSCKNTGIFLDASGEATLDPRELYNGNVNDPLIEKFSVDKENFTCDDLGPQPVILSVHFKDGTTEECSTQIVVKDAINPEVFCVAPGKKYTLSNGSVTIDVNDLVAGLDDNCGVVDFYLSEATFTSAGTKTVIINAEDSSGLVGTCQTTVEIVEPSTTPGACKTATILLDETGSATLDAEEVFDGDPNADSISGMSLSRSSFSCEDLEAPVEVNLTVNYSDGSSTTCSALVTVKDQIKPVAVCVEEFTLHLNEAGVGRITPEIINRGSTDNCEFLMSLSKESFGVEDIGEQEVTLTVTDAAGNTSTCITTVTVVAFDEENPGINCVDDITLPLNETGDFKLKLNYTGDEANEDYTLSKDTFSCEDIGTQTITVTYWGEYTGSCEIEITVVDDTPPVIECLDEISIKLDASGNAVVSAEDLDLEFSDNCSVAESSLSRTNFTTADIGQSQITFTVIDGSGNVSTCTTTVNVIAFEEEEPQPIECVDLHVIEIGENGKAVLNPRDLFTGGTGTAQFEVSKDTFTCLDLGENTVTLNYSTPSGNGSCEVTVVVEDPAGICEEPVDPSTEDYIILYPNPSLGVVSFQTSSGLEIHRIEVFDMRGRYLFEKVYENNSIFDRKLDLREHQSGVYSLLIFTNGKEYLKRAIIKN